MLKVSTSAFIPFTAHNVHFYLSFFNMYTLSLEDRWGRWGVNANVGCFWRESCSFVACELKGVKETGFLVCLLCGQAQKGGSCVLGVSESRYSHLTSSFVHITRTSQREHVPSEGFTELSGLPLPIPPLTFLLHTCTHTHTDTEPPAHWDASWLSQSHFPFASCSFKVILSLSVERLFSWSSGSLPPIKRTTLEF